jgi:hypothetical protein
MTISLANSMPVVGLLRERAQPTVRVTDGGVKEDPADARQHRVAQPPVRPGHRARLDPAQEPIADHEVVAFSELGDQRRDRSEVIARIGVTHDDEPSLRRVDAADQRAAVSLSLNVDDPGAELAREQLRTVAAPIVGDDDLGRVPALVDGLARLGDACC